MGASPASLLPACVVPETALFNVISALTILAWSSPCWFRFFLVVDVSSRAWLQVGSFTKSGSLIRETERRTVRLFCVCFVPARPPIKSADFTSLSRGYISASRPLFSAALG